MPQNTVIDKKRLVTACQTGNREAQALLYTTYRCKMLKIIRQYVADYDMAQDVLHDGFLIILSQIQSLRKPECLDYWMATIMKNLSIHTLSQIKFEDILEEQEENVEDEFDGDLSYDELMVLIERLPNGYQTVFRLAVLEGKSHQEIADMLGISPKSSASQLAHAKEKLRLLITEHRKKAGLLAMLLLVVCISYHYFINKVTQVDVPTKEIVKNDKNQQPVKEEKQEKKIEFVKSDIIHALTKANNDVSMNAVDSMLIASDSQESIIIQHETADSSEQRNDTTKNAPLKELVAPKLYAEKEIKAIPHPHSKKWGLNISTNALGIGSNSNSINNGNSPMADPDPNGGHSGSTKEETTSVHHLLPLTFGVRIFKEFSPRWGMETGVQYNLLRSDITKTIGDWSYIKNVKAHYISIPIAVKYHFLQWKKANVYTLTGMSLDIPIGSSIDCEIRREDLKLYYPLSFSIDAGIGFEYQISPTTTLYIQPSLNYHIMGKSEYPILWQDQPFSFDLPIGIRFSW